MTTYTTQDAIADATEWSKGDQEGSIGWRHTMKLLLYEIDRLNQCITHEQNRLERIGTHGTNCYRWGHHHYECAIREIERLKNEN